MPNGLGLCPAKSVQRYCCPNCQQTFCESFDTLYYYRHVSPAQIDQVLQAHSEGSSLRGISRTSGLAYNEDWILQEQSIKLVEQSTALSYC